MLAAFYIGDHKDDDFWSRVGYFLIRLGQSAEKYGYATHCEAIQGGPWWNCSIIGASRRDGKQVRQKTVRLTPGNWRILSVPAWDLADFNARAMPLLGTPYSDFGAAASASMLVRVIAWALQIDIASLSQWCSRFLGQGAGVYGAEDLSVSELMAHAVNLYGTVDVTDAYFSTPES
jgi:hypothetical protein